MVDFEFDKNDSSTFYNPYLGNRKATSKLDPEVTYLAYYYDEVPENSSINKTSTVPQRTENQMAMSLPLKYPEAYVAAIFPEMMDAKNTRVAFYSTKHSTSTTSVSAYYVGVMSDASDITTFQPIDTIVPDLRYVYYVYDLNKYKVDGKFFAILLENFSKIRSNFKGRIDL